LESSNHERSSRLEDYRTVIENKIRELVVDYEYSRIVSLKHADTDIRFKEGIDCMRTTKSLTEAVAYENGKPVYNGDIERIYTSEMIVSLQVHLVRAPQGAKIENFAEDELKTIVKRLRPGQIGSLKETDEDPVLGSEPFLELVIPCDRTNTVTIAETCRSLTKPEEVTGGMTCTIKAKPQTVDTVKELISPHRDSNREIQKRWIEFVKTDRAKAMSSAVKLQQKERIYSDYVSLTEYTLVVSGSIKHVVNNPFLKSTVKSNADQSYYNLVNYNKGNEQVRKFALDKLQIVSIPIVTRADYDKALSRLKAMVKNSEVISYLRKLGGEEVFHDEGIFGNTSIDWQRLKDLDSIARQNQRLFWPPGRRAPLTQDGRFDRCHGIAAHHSVSRYALAANDALVALRITPVPFTS
jgi:hypothetical protein